MSADRLPEGCSHPGFEACQRAPINLGAGIEEGRDAILSSHPPLPVTPRGLPSAAAPLPCRRQPWEMGKKRGCSASLGQRRGQGLLTGACNPEALPKCGETDCKLKFGDYRGKKTGRLFPLSPKKEQEGLSNSAACLLPTFPLNRDKSVASCTATQGSSAKGGFHTA